MAMTSGEKTASLPGRSTICRWMYASGAAVTGSRAQCVECEEAVLLTQSLSVEQPAVSTEWRGQESLSTHGRPNGWMSMNQW